MIILIDCFRLINELNSKEGEIWKEKLPSDQNDIERFVIYLKLKTNYSEETRYEWYFNHAEQFYLDACYILAIRFYSNCIELQPDMKNTYLKRAASYLKVFEVGKQNRFHFVRKINLIYFSRKR